MVGRTPALIAAAAVMLTAASLGLLAWQRSGPADAGTTATLGGLTAEVRQAGWVDFDMGHVMDGQGGFMMPDAMMPGAPRGDDIRLGLTLTLVNTGSRVHEFNPAEEFSIVGRTRTAPPSADSLGALPRLAPGTAVDGTLYFDVPAPAEDDPPLYLRWQRDGDTARLAVPLDPAASAPAPAHDHD